MRKTLKLLVGMIGLTLISYIIALTSVVVFPWFNHIPTILMVLTGVIGIIYGRGCKYGLSEKIVVTFLYVFFGLFMFVVLWVSNPREFHTEFPSPDGAQTVVMEYDHASRPTVYRKVNSWFMIKLETPNTMGSMSIIQYRIKWLSDNEIILLGSDDYQYHIMVH